MGKDNGETLDGLRRVDDLPPWARHLSQPRDPEDGFLWPRRCGRSGSGHTPNVVQIKVCLRDTPRKGKLLGVEDNVISVDFGDQIVRYRNHEPERLLEIVGIGGTVRVFSSLLQSWSDYCFSILDADAQWIPCDDEPLRSTTTGALV